MSKLFVLAHLRILIFMFIIIQNPSSFFIFPFNKNSINIIFFNISFSEIFSVFINEF